jgi:hypothetical protein
VKQQKLIPVEVVKTHDYSGLPRIAGSTYEIDPKDLSLFLKLGRVKAVTAKTGQYQRKDMRAED